MKKPDRLIPRKEPQQRRSRVTYDAILEAAAQILIERGYAATTTNHIARRAGISIGSLYQYFPSKEAIAVYLVPARLENIFVNALSICFILQSGCGLYSMLSPGLISMPCHTAPGRAASIYLH